MSKLEAWAIVVAFGLFIWNALPLWMVTALPATVPLKNKIAAIASLAVAGLKGITVIPFVVLSPIVVPIALLFAKREDEQLKGIFWPWGNDVSINGDRPNETEAYYAPGHDTRSYWARFVWLVLRNRASRYAQWIGHTWKPGEYDDHQHWGDSAVGRNHEGWTLNRRAHLYQLYMVKKVGPLCIRVNFGHKVWADAGDLRPNTMVVNITFSMLRWTGV